MISQIKSTPKALIDNAKTAEYMRDMIQLEEILSPVWTNINTKPDFSNYDFPMQAELYRLCGFYLIYTGYTKNKLDYQERGKDLLTKAIEMYDGLEMEEERSLAEIDLALSYWYEGSVSEADAVLSSVLPLSSINNLIYAKTNICRMIFLISRGEYQKAYTLSQCIEDRLSKVNDFRLRMQYLIETGFTCRRSGKLEMSIDYYERALVLAENFNNKNYIAIIKGNLSFAYNELSNFDKAHALIDEVIEINKSSGNDGFLGHNFDTKCLIYWKSGELEKALDFIEQAVNIFRQGEDYAGFADALFNKSKLLFEMKKSLKGLVTMTELLELARIQLGEKTRDYYAGELLKLFYIKGNKNYRKEVRQFREELVREALVKTGKDLSKTKDILQISQQNLSEIMNNQFPHLYDELDIPRRRSRKKKVIPIFLDKVYLQEYESRSLVMFEVPADFLPELDVEEVAVVGVLRHESLRKGGYFAVKSKKGSKISCGKLLTDDLDLDLFYFENRSGDPFVFGKEDVMVIGRIVGWNNKAEINNDEITLKNL